MARVLRTRQAVNNEFATSSPTKMITETSSSRSMRSKRFQTPENPGSNSSNSRRNSQTSGESSDVDHTEELQHFTDNDDDNETIYVRPIIPDRSSSQDSPRKRRKITRIPGSPSAQLIQIIAHPVNASRSSVAEPEDGQAKMESPDQIDQYSLKLNGDSPPVRPHDETPVYAAGTDVLALKSEMEEQTNADPDSTYEKFPVQSSLIVPELREQSSIEQPQSTVSAVPRRLSHSSTGSAVVNMNDEPPTPTDPDDLSDTDLPPPFLVISTPPSESSYSDMAAYILASKYAPLSDPQAVISALLKHDPSARSTETLFTLAENTQRTLRAWQDEYLAIDKKTAPIGNPPKKPATGGREPQDPAHFEQSKETTLYSRHHAHEHVSNRGGSTGDINTVGRELRRRRDAGLIDGLIISEDDAGGGTDRGKGKRSRRPVRKFDDGRLGTVTPDRNGAGAPGTSSRRTAGDGDVENNRRRRARISTLARSDGDLSPTPDGSDGGDDQMYGSRRRKGARGGASSATGAKRKKQRVKSEKRSESMTAWWAERKRKAAEQKIREMRERGLLEAKEIDELGTPAEEMPSTVNRKPTDAMAA